MILCETCRKAEATFRCRGDGVAMPAHLKHEPHYSCDGCDRGNGCRMVAGEKIVEKAKGSA